MGATIIKVSIEDFMLSRKLKPIWQFSTSLNTFITRSFTPKEYTMVYSYPTPNKIYRVYRENDGFYCNLIPIDIFVRKFVNCDPTTLLTVMSPQRRYWVSLSERLGPCPSDFHTQDMFINNIKYLSTKKAYTRIAREILKIQNPNNVSNYIKILLYRALLHAISNCHLASFDKRVVIEGEKTFDYELIDPFKNNWTDHYYFINDYLYINTAGEITFTDSFTPGLRTTYLNQFNEFQALAIKLLHITRRIPKNLHVGGKRPVKTIYRKYLEAILANPYEVYKVI